MRDANLSLCKAAVRLADFVSGTLRVRCGSDTSGIHAVALDLSEYCRLVDCVSFVLCGPDDSSVLEGGTV